MTDDPAYIDGPGLTPDEIREFPGLTDPTVNARLTTARLLKNKVMLRLQPARCWIETPGPDERAHGKAWFRTGPTLNLAAEAALLEYETYLGSNHDVEKAYLGLRRLLTLGATVTDRAIMDSTSPGADNSLTVRGFEYRVTLPDGRVAIGAGARRPQAIATAVQQADDLLKHDTP